MIVPETTPINDLLLQFRNERQQMAAVIDEWGSFEGIATVEDVVEAVVGDLRDEFDIDSREPSVRRRDDGSYAVDGSVPLSAVNETLDTTFESEEYETIGGLVLARLGRGPEVGDVVETDDVTFEVSDLEGSRILTLRATKKRDKSSFE